MSDKIKLLGVSMGIYLMSMAIVCLLVYIHTALRLPVSMLWVEILLFVALLLWVFYKFSTKRTEGSLRKQLGEMPLEQLKSETFNCPYEYFASIGESDAAVQRFKDLIRLEDIDTLKLEWRELSACFRQLERKSGFRGGRDYFCLYEVNLEILAKRMQEKSNAGVTSGR